MENDDICFSDPFSKVIIAAKLKRRAKVKRDYKIALYDHEIIKISVKLPEEVAIKYKLLGYSPARIRKFIKHAAEMKLNKIYMEMVLKPSNLGMLDM